MQWRHSSGPHQSRPLWMHAPLQSGAQRVLEVKGVVQGARASKPKQRSRVCGTADIADQRWGGLVVGVVVGEGGRGGGGRTRHEIGPCTQMRFACKLMMEPRERTQQRAGAVWACWLGQVVHKDVRSRPPRLPIAHHMCRSCDSPCVLNRGPVRGRGPMLSKRQPLAAKESSIPAAKCKLPVTRSQMDQAPCACVCDPRRLQNMRHPVTYA